jgi:predicted SnoaL-like aldol condensation-catalyzing enzyme
MTASSDVRGGGQPGNRKQIAVDFLHLVVAGQIPEAYRKYVDMQGTHHNPFFRAGFPALQEAMAADHTKFPDKRITVRNVLGDGQFVAVHSRLDFGEDERSYATVHIFRFHGDRIVELWDLGQAVPPEAPNEDGMF